MGYFHSVVLTVVAWVGRGVHAMRRDRGSLGCFGDRHWRRLMPVIGCIHVVRVSYGRIVTPGYHLSCICGTHVVRYRSLCDGGRGYVVLQS